LFYQVIRSWNYPRLSAVLGALTYGLGTMAWPYTKTLFTQPLAALGLLIAIWGVSRAQADHRKTMALLGGAGLGIAGVSAVPTWITLPLYLLYLAPWESLSQRWRWAEMKQTAGLCALFLLGAGPFALFQLGYNWARFGSPLQTGYQLIGTTDFKLLYFGIAGFGQLLSTPRGIIWYAPVVLLAPFGLVWAWKNGRVRPLLLVLGQAALIFCLYSVYYFWWGGGSYGPRFLMAVMPAMTLLTIPLLDGLAANPRRWILVPVGILLLISVATEALGSIVDIYTSYNRMYEGLNALTPPPAFFVNAPVLTDFTWIPQFQFPLLVQKGQLDLLMLATGNPDWLLLAAQIAMVVLSGLMLISLLRFPSRAVARWGLATQAVLMAGLMIFMLVRYPRAYGFSKTVLPPPPGLDEVIATVSDEAMPGDGIAVMLYQPASDAWLDRYDGRIHDVGLTIEAPLRAETVQKLDHIQTWHRRVWLITNGSTAGDPANGVEAWFAQRAYAGSNKWIEGFRIVPYIFAPDIGTLQPLF